ncbi:zinc finger protein 652 [Biomphalaria pfeifferi]|uniref:Zinc finger protein 652 n=1 Tax=Biomphalaria pfeifferi TaxID=112525 RepID=A0AAD8B3C7_BIOPF|nr:zinc finger protein 652 [Biomphalaria pfeifferi]
MATYIPRSGTFYDPDSIKGTLSALNHQRSISQFCDVVLRVSGTQIFAHSNVLAAASPYFGSFLGTGTDCPRMFSQKHPQVIEIHIDTKEGDLGYGEAVCRVVDFMYTSKIVLTTDLVCQIIQISKIMQMDKLLQFCEYFQNGENDNIPKDIATCTTGLQEIAQLLGSRFKTVKKADVSTMTEASMFLKIADPAAGNSTNITTTNDTLSSNPVDTPSNLQLTVSNHNGISLIKQRDNKEEEFSGLKVKTELGFESLSIDQNDASLLLEIGNVRLPGEQVNKTFLHFSENAPDKNIKPQITDSPMLAQEDCFSGVQVLADMMSLAVGKQDTEQSLMQTQKPSLTTDKNFVLEDQSQKDINLEEISDLVRFDPVTTAILQASNVSKRGHTRGRGRGRGRGRRPGRPRKSKEEPDSDPEFEEFMDTLERGDPVVPSVGENISDSRILKDFDTDKEMMETEQGLSTEKSNLRSEIGISSWKSRRSRSKPSHIRKDYIMHSLTKRSRRQTEISKLNTFSGKSKPIEFKEPATGIKFVCQKCDFTTSLFKSYRQHLKSHPETDPRYFVCEKCDFKTTKSREFTAHKQKHMNEELICSFCEHQSETMEDFLEHAKKHEGDFPYFCPECDSKFKTKNQLIAHKPKHQLEKPFVCAICKSGFKWKHALKNHMITHSATKDHLCDVCGYATAHKSQLKAHKLIHTGHMFKCPVQGCPFEATKRQNLKYHMVTHTHEKPHQCEVCGQSFSLIKNMRRHMLLHTDSRPFSCKICSFSTTRYDKLKEHNHKMHNIGDAPVSRTTDIAEEAVSLLNSNVTYVSGDSITINSDGGITEETLHTIAQLASAQNLSAIELQGTTINIEQTGEDGTVYPFIATVQAYTDSSGEVQYIAEIPE